MFDGRSRTNADVFAQRDEWLRSERVADEESWFD